MWERETAIQRTMRSKTRIGLQLLWVPKRMGKQGQVQNLQILSNVILSSSYLKMRNDHHSVKSVQKRSFFWSDYTKIRTRKNSVFGRFSQQRILVSDVLKLNDKLIRFTCEGHKFLTYKKLFLKKAGPLNPTSTCTQNLFLKRVFDY